MKKFPTIFALILSLMATAAHVMDENEENNEITKARFNQTGISFMQKFLDRYVKAAAQ
jgi:hypothetical protein